MTHLLTQTDNRAGRITLNRPDVRNALNWDMCHQIEAQLDALETDPEIDLILIDGSGDRAFCAGGDIADLYRTALTGDFAYGRRFWTDEYRLNAKLGTGPKPIVTFLHGFTLGGGVGLGCHGPHRIVCENSRVALPEVQIGLVPDVGSTYLLAQAPGRAGEYLGVTARRMDAADAIWAGFADHFVPQDRWDDLKRALGCGNVDVISEFSVPPPTSPLAQFSGEIDTYFAGETLQDIETALRCRDSDFAKASLERMSKPSPLAMAAAVELVHRARIGGTLVQALEQEYRFTFRAAEQGDLLEGIRTAIIDRDASACWQHQSFGLACAAATRMVMPLGADTLNLTEPLI